MYGSGLRLLECLRLRVKDLDFDHRAILVRDGKGGKDRVVTLPDELIPIHWAFTLAAARQKLRKLYPPNEEGDDPLSNSHFDIGCSV